MTHESDDERLDELLGQWIRQSADPDHMDQLHGRIVSSLADLQSRSADHVRVPEAGARKLIWQRNAGVAMSIATVLLLIISVIFRTPNERAMDTQVVRLPLPESVWLRDDQLQHKAALLLAMEDMFSGSFLWAAESGEQLEFGLADDDGIPRLDRGTRVVVRVLVERREIGSKEWQTTWVRDVLSRDEQFITTSSQEDGSVLRLWTYCLPDGQIAVESELELTGPHSLYAVSSGVQQHCRPVQVVDVQEQNSEYRVLQTVAVLNREVI